MNVTDTDCTLYRSAGHRAGQLLQRNAEGVGHVDEEPDSRVVGLGSCAGQVLTRSVFKREESNAPFWKAESHTSPLRPVPGRYLYIVLFESFFYINTSTTGFSVIHLN